MVLERKQLHEGATVTEDASDPESQKMEMASERRHGTIFKRRWNQHGSTTGVIHLEVGR